jgi:hypothetical protein
MNMYLSALAIYDCLALTMNFMIGVLRGQNKNVNKTFQDYEDLCKFHGVIVEVFNLLSIWIIVSFTIERPNTESPSNPETAILCIENTRTANETPVIAYTARLGVMTFPLSGNLTMINRSIVKDTMIQMESKLNTSTMTPWNLQRSS